MSTITAVQVAALPLPRDTVAENEASISNFPQNHVKNTKVQRMQDVLLLKGVKEKYNLVNNHPLPEIIHPDEILVKVVAIGLNPIDWKAPAFNFGIPSFPWINGRDLAGIVISAPSSSPSSRIRVGDLVLVPSTDYRDIRKAAFQQYAIATSFNAARIPHTTCRASAAATGVAFVTAALALGVCFGGDFSATDPRGPSLPDLLASLNAQEIPEDIREQCLASSWKTQRIKPGDWLAIWGASTTTGFLTLQLAKLIGLKVLCIADIARHGTTLQAAGADFLIDRLDTTRAVQIIRGVTGGKLRFAIDTVGRESAAVLQGALSLEERGDEDDGANLLGLTGLPNERDPHMRYHTVPIKLFHSSPTVGEVLVSWLERLLETGKLRLPGIVKAEGGLAGVNEALEWLRDGRVSGRRIVVDLD